MAKGDINKTYNNVANMRSFDNMTSGNNANSGINNMQQPPQKPRLSDLGGNTGQINYQNNQQTQQQPMPNIQPSVNQQRGQKSGQNEATAMKSNLDLLGVAKAKRSSVKFKPDEKPVVTAGLPTISPKIKLIILGVLGLIVLIILCNVIKPLKTGISQLFGNYNTVWSERTTNFYDSVYTWGDEFQEYLTTLSVNNGFQGSLNGKSLTISSDGKQLYIIYDKDIILISEKEAIINFNGISGIKMSTENLASYVKLKGFSLDDILWFRAVALSTASTTLSSDDSLHKIFDDLWTKFEDIPCKNTRTAKVYQLEDFKVGMQGIVQAIKGDSNIIKLATSCGMETQDFYNLMSTIDSNITNITGVDGTVSITRKSDTLYVMDVGTDVFTMDLSDGCTISATNFYFSASQNDFTYRYKGYEFNSTVSCDSGLLTGTVVIEGETYEFNGSSIKTSKGTFDFIPVMLADYSDASSDIDITRVSVSSDTEEMTESMLALVEKSDIDLVELAGFLNGSSIDYEYDSSKLNDVIANWLTSLRKNNAVEFKVNSEIIGRNRKQELKAAILTANTNANAIYRASTSFIAECGSAPNGVYSGVLTEKSGSINYKTTFETKNLESCLGMSVTSGYYCFVVKNNVVTYAAWSADVDLSELVSNRTIKTSYDAFSDVDEVIGTYPTESGV